jgi:hypothetical protein
MAEAKKSPKKKPAKGKKPAAAKKPATRKAAPKKAAARKAAPKKAPVRKAAPKKAAARKAAPKKAPVRKAAPKKATAPKKPAAASSGASAPRSGAGAPDDRGGYERIKPQVAAAAEAIESKISEFIETADVRNFPDKLWRLLAMIAFAFVGYWVFVLVVILAAMQWFVVLLGDKPSPEIAHYMGRCSAYVRQVLDLLSYRSETLPWPLGPLPGETADE